MGETAEAGWSLRNFRRVHPPCQLFPDEKKDGPMLATTFALAVLQLEKGILPFYHR